MASSHHDSPPPSPGQNSEFPIFADGDVLIKLSDVRSFQLHSVTLRENSTFFRAALVENNAAQLSRKAIREGVVIRYRFEFQLPVDEDDSTGQLLLRPLRETGHPYGPAQALPIENGLLPYSIYRHYTNVFTAYYHQPILEINDANIALVLPEIIELMAVAEYLGSGRVVATLVDNLLMKQGQMLYRSIADAPIPWASLGARLKSETVFREAVIHAVGQWNMLEPMLVGNGSAHVPDDVMQLIKKKANEQDELKRAVECRIMGHYPKSLRHPLPSPLALPPKVTLYGADIMGWMTLSLFRHWVAQQVTADRTRRAADGGAAFYRAMSYGALGMPSPALTEATEANNVGTTQTTKKRKRKQALDAATYLGREDIESFCRHFPMSAKAKNLLEEQLGILKEAVKPFVHHLVINKSALDIKSFPVEYLTCCSVLRKEMPWLVESNGVEGAGPDRDAINTDDNANKSTTMKRGNTTTLPAHSIPSPRKRQHLNIPSTKRNTELDAEEDSDYGLPSPSKDTEFPTAATYRTRNLDAAAQQILREGGWAGGSPFVDSDELVGLAGGEQEDIEGEEDFEGEEYYEADENGLFLSSSEGGGR